MVGSSPIHVAQCYALHMKRIMHVVMTLAPSHHQCIIYACTLLMVGTRQESAHHMLPPFALTTCHKLCRKKQLTKLLVMHGQPTGFGIPTETKEGLMERSMSAHRRGLVIHMNCSLCRKGLPVQHVDSPSLRYAGSCDKEMPLKLEMTGSSKKMKRAWAAEPKELTTKRSRD
jgi:hypothetical protein